MEIEHQNICNYMKELINHGSDNGRFWYVHINTIS